MPKTEQINSKMTNYRITVNKDEISVDIKDLATIDSIKVYDSSFHVLEDNQTYRINLLQADYLNKTLKISVNGNTYDLKIEDEFDIRVKEMGLLAATSQKVNSVKAPMPGLIIDIMVKVGQMVSEGTPLVVLSAMKMENIILSPGDGTIKSIMVNQEGTVDKGQLIIEFE